MNRFKISSLLVFWHIPILLTILFSLVSADGNAKERSFKSLLNDLSSNGRLPEPPEYKPPVYITWIYNGNKLERKLTNKKKFKIDRRIDLSTYRFDPIPRTWFIDYSDNVNRCIEDSKCKLKNIVDSEYFNFPSTINEGSNIDAALFDYCTKNYKGFDILRWRTDDNKFKNFNRYHSARRIIFPFVHL